MDEQPIESAVGAPLGDATPPEAAEQAEADALIDRIAEADIEARTAAQPAEAAKPPPGAEAGPAAKRTNLTEAILDPGQGPSEQDLVNDIDAILADVSDLAEEPSGQVEQEDRPTPAEPRTARPPGSRKSAEPREPDEPAEDPDALLEKAERLAAAGGTRLDATETAPEDGQTEPPTNPAELDAALAVRVDRLAAEETAQRGYLSKGPAVHRPEAGDAVAERTALLTDADEPTEAQPRGDAAPDASAPESAAGRPGAGGLAGRALAALVRLIERPIQQLSDDARYTVNVLALAFLIGSVSLLAYALFFAR